MKTSAEFNYSVETAALTCHSLTLDILLEIKLLILINLVSTVSGGRWYLHGIRGESIIT